MAAKTAAARGLGVRLVAVLLPALLVLGCLAPFVRGEEGNKKEPGHGRMMPLLQPADRQQQREMGSILEQPRPKQGGGGKEEKELLQPKILVADGPELSSFPSVSNSTILFLHVFKV